MNSRMSLFSHICLLGTAFLLTATQSLRAQTPSPAQEPLVTRIDRAFQARPSLLGKPLLVDDATFARRVSLDLTGMPLATDRLQAFLADKAADKRARLVNELIETPQATRHLATWLSLTLLERRPAKVANDDLWMAWLMDLVRHDKPLDTMTADLLTATGEEGPKQVAARFLMDRDAEPNLLTRDAGRIFLGRDMQCAQCHDHPIVDGYLQSDYHALLTFFAPTSVAPVKRGDKQISLLSEKAGSKDLFDSVFVKDDSLITGPRLPGQPTLTEAADLPGDEYIRRPTESTTAEPRQSRRALLAQTLVASPAFRQTWANRIWAFTLGRGVVHPPDFTHPDNPPVDAQLLDTIAQAFVQQGFRLKPMLKAIVLSQAYQRPFDLPAELAQAPKPGDLAELKSQLDRYTAELKTAETHFNSAKAAWHKAQAAVVPIFKKRDPIQAKLDEFGGKLSAANLRLAAITVRLTEIDTQRPPLADAKTAADKAVTALAGDKDLAAAAKAFTDRLAKNDAEKAALTDEQAKKAVERRLAEEQLAAFRVQAKAVDAELAPLLATVRQLEEPFRAARLKLDELSAHIAHTKNEIAWHETRSKFLESQQALKLINTQLAQIEPTAKAAAADLQSAKTLGDQAQAQLAARQRELAEATQKLQQATQTATASDQAAQALKRALAETQNAARLAPMAQFGQLISQIQMQIDKVAAASAQDQARLAPVQADAKRLETSLPELQQKAKLAGEHLAALTKKAEGLATELKAAQERRTKADSTLAELTETLVRQATERFELAALKPLSPESLAWSVLKTTKVYDSYWAQEKAALDKAKPPTNAQKADPAWNVDRVYEIEAQVFAKLRSYPQHFATLYGAGAGQPQADFFATADQANGGAVASWCLPSPGNPADGIIKAKTPKEAADALYFGVLGRTADPDETALVAKALAQATDKTRATIAADLVWGLMTSPEYRFNH